MHTRLRYFRFSTTVKNDQYRHLPANSEIGQTAFLELE
jgi:hypothetical protein